MWSATLSVGGWLRGRGLVQYAANFVDNKIDLDKIDLDMPPWLDGPRRFIGVSALGDRLRLLDAIAALVGL